jgi:hypothetical protein
VLGLKTAGGLFLLSQSGANLREGYLEVENVFPHPQEHFLIFIIVFLLSLFSQSGANFLQGYSVTENVFPHPQEHSLVFLKAKPSAIFFSVTCA